MKYVIKWYVSADDPDTYMGEDVVRADSIDAAARHAEDIAEGFEFLVEKGGE